MRSRGSVAPVKLKKFLIAVSLLAVFAAAAAVSAQVPPAPAGKSIEVSDSDGIPVLIKHLPEWQKVKDSAVMMYDAGAMRQILGPRHVLDAIEFGPGTEAVTAQYDAGKLLIVEYTSPMLSTDADAKVNQLISQGQSPNTVYRRIGNYNAFVFDVSDEEAANALLGQVKYEKSIQWLGEDPFYQNRAERNFVVTTSDIFLSTVLVIVLGMVLSIVGGLFAGVLFFYRRELRRSRMSEFSDAGGMTRLNLDHLTPDISPDRLLGE